VWTTLFLLMGVAAYLVWRSGSQTKPALRIFGFQLALNMLWSILFFGLQNPGTAFVEIIFLWLSIAWTMYAFAKHSTLAAWLLSPYLAWVTFAGTLNYFIWTLN
jgi:tryptophan-rich sensory protein